MSGNQKFLIGIIAVVCLALALAAALGGMQRASLVSAAIGGAAPLHYGQEGLRVSGTAVVRAAPELATVRLGYESRARRAREAKLQNDAVMKKILAALEKSGVERKDIQTVEYRLFPMWENWPVPTTHVWVWHVLNMVEVRIRKVDTAADVIDAASAAGADKVENVVFSVESLHKLRGQAREMACKVAREKAEQLAKEMGVKLGKTMSITDSTPRYSYYSPWSRYASASNVMAQAQAEVPSNSSEPDSLVRGGQIVVESTEEVVYSLE